MKRYIEDISSSTVRADSTELSQCRRTPTSPKLYTKRRWRRTDDKYANSELGKKFRRLVMQRLYCAHQARPDIAVSVSMLTRVQAWPSPDLLNRAEKILAYLSGTKELGPIYKAKESVRPTLNWAPKVEVEGASDASFDVAHSTSGHVFFSSGAAIARATKIKEAALHCPQLLYEAEVVAGSEAACQAVAIRGLLEELHIKQHEPTTLSMDNTQHGRDRCLMSRAIPCTTIGPSTLQGATSSSASSLRTISSSPSSFGPRTTQRTR